VPDGRHPTCSGGGAAADLMLDYVRRTNGDRFVEQIASILMIDGVRDGRLQQVKPADLRFATSNKQIFAAVKLMNTHSYDPIPVQEIADRIGLSQRQLERLFKTEFDLSPAKAYAEIRMAGARQEVIAGRRPLIDIALDYGYNVGTFSKVYRRVFGVLPSEDRQGPA
jgi:transcriptional regulator GlxA family with amidase domain